MAIKMQVISTNSSKATPVRRTNNSKIKTLTYESKFNWKQQMHYYTECGVLEASVHPFQSATIFP